MRIRLFLILSGFVTFCFAHAEKVVLGKLGQTIAQATIYTRPSPKARAYCRVKPYEYLVLQEAPSKTYYKVLLSTGASGYVPTASVAKLPYNVTAEQNPGYTRDTGLLTSRSRAAVASYATKFEGTPYKWGGNDPLHGIDCSAFVKYLYGQIGVKLPRTAAQQVNVGRPIKRLEELQSGDRLYFWSSKRNMIGHTGIYLGNGYFVHSSSNHKGVATDYLGSKKWLSILVAARR